MPPTDVLAMKLLLCHNIYGRVLLLCTMYSLICGLLELLDIWRKMESMKAAGCNDQCSGGSDPDAEGVTTMSSKINKVIKKIIQYLIFSDLFLSLIHPNL